jgi:CO/xanthine dehydrogenase Mo-binding subunit
VQRCVATILGIKNSSCIDVQVKQIGGGFGGKATRHFAVASAALAAHILNVPVKVQMDLNDCMVYIYTLANNKLSRPAKIYFYKAKIHKKYLKFYLKKKFI